MTFVLLLVAIVILLCVMAEKFSGKFGMPALILFMFIGMLFGSDGIFKIPFDDYRLAENICSIALLFIMFYGGFNLKWTLAGCGGKIHPFIDNRRGCHCRCHCTVCQTGFKLHLYRKASWSAPCWAQLTRQAYLPYCARKN